MESSRSTFRRLRLIFLLLFVCVGGIHADDSVFKAEAGVVDLRQFIPGRTETVELDGEWAFYWDTVVDAETGLLPSGAEPDHLINVPAYWDDLEEIDGRITPRGTATYRLTILMPGQPELYALKFRNITPNAEVYIDGILKAELGKVNRDPRHSVSGNSILVIPFTAKGPEVTVTVGISNFHNVNGGLNRSVEFGLYSDIRQGRESALSHDALFLGGLLLMGLYQVALFLLHRKSPAPLFMALLCFLAFFFAGFKHEMVLLAMFPGWDGEIRTTFIYLALAMAPAAFTYYAYYLYPAHFNTRLNFVFAVFSLLFGVFIVVTEKSLFTKAIIPLQIVVILAAIYNIVSLLRGYVRSKDGYILLYLGGLLFLLASIFVGMIDNAFTDIFGSISAIFFVFVLYQAFLQAFLYSYTFREIDFLTVQKAKLEKRNVELFGLSYIDNLTGCCNRRLFDDYLASNWRVSALSGKSLGMIILDIDEFKDYNEFYGHRQGDVCLSKTCDLVRAEMNKHGQDTLARYGGEEFAIIVSEISPSDLFEMAERVRRAVESGGMEHRSSTTADVVTISLGCAVVTPEINKDPETLIDAADVALHRAKREGRNRTVMGSALPSSWKPRIV